MKYLKLLFIFALLFTFKTADAGEVAGREILGFSKDGKYMAWEESWTGDESAFETCKIYFINVAENKWAKEPLSQTAGDADVPAKVPACKSLRKKAAPVLQSLGISKANTNYERVVNHDIQEVYPPTQEQVLPAPTIDKVKFNINPTPPFSLFIQKYAELTSYQKDYKTPDGQDLKMVKVVLKIDGKEKVLQDDQSLPKSRMELMPIGYRIGEVYLNDSSIIVFLDMFIGASFEGPSRRTLAITGSLKP